MSDTSLLSSYICVPDYPLRQAHGESQTLYYITTMRSTSKKCLEKRCRMVAIMDELSQPGLVVRAGDFQKVLLF